MVRTIEELEVELSDADEEIDRLKEELKGAEQEAKDLQEKLDEAPDLEDFSESEISAAFYQNNSIDGTMVNEIKIELFFANLDRFSVEQFEEFLKPFTV